jgi:sigma-B regulation protein RsbU (phosphoserine phosphatase)
LYPGTADSAELQFFSPKVHFRRISRLNSQLARLCDNFSAVPLLPFLKNRAPLSPMAAEPSIAETPLLQGAEIAAAFYAPRQAGDFCDFIRVSQDRVLFGLLDVAGRREDNQGILSAAQTTFRESGKELFADPAVNDPDAMFELCLRLNRNIIEAAGGVRSCPAFVGSYNETLGTIWYVNAGHTPGLLRDDSGISEIAATTLPLGLFPYATTDAKIVALEPGGALLVVSRGVVEGQCKREEFGLERAQEVLKNTVGKSANEIGTRVLEAVQQFMCAAPTHNDVTALVLMRSRNSASLPT